MSGTLDWGQLAKGLIGQSDKQVLARETDTYRGPGTSVERTGIEQIMDGIFRGGSSESLNELSKKKYVKELREQYGSKLELLDEDVRRDLGIVDRSGINASMSEADIARQINAGTRLQDARRRASATRGIDRAILASTDPDAIQRGIEEAEVRTKNTDTTNSPIYQNELKQQNLTNQLALGQLSLAEQRNANQMTIAMMDNQLERRRQDSADRRADRKDRQAMIQQMMQGLATLGTSIAI